jgi:F0F1-type ATP synthase assembly protein I
MSRDGDQQNQSVGDIFLSRNIITMAVQVGCLTFGIIIGSLIAGLWLDRFLDTLPLFTIIFLVGSMPVSWVFVFRLVIKTKAKIIREAENIAGLKKLEDEDSD